MNLTVNGDARGYKGKATVEGLLKAMSIDCGRVAVMVNDVVISRRKFSSAKLAEGDRVEILTFAGGG
jgi:sulfur carrier protein